MQIGSLLANLLQSVAVVTPNSITLDTLEINLVLLMMISVSSATSSTSGSAEKNTDRDRRQVSEDAELSSVVLAE
eukprot:6182708-Pleurochrysis_carterae.AAC.3